MGVQEISKRKNGHKERLALRNKVKEEEHLRDLRGVMRRNSNGLQRLNRFGSGDMRFPVRCGCYRSILLALQKNRRKICVGL